ncbi:MAG TPA: glycoside hydrolase family 38 C-terminal domain-containing protein [Pseudonocardiaceae bacterium]|nr:glycoside hydrolase family 38 C-terminal domain-containing protein [Pseudonocardiaceae bacterium]
MYLVSHFHYDPVWWNTQAGYTATWELQGNDGSTRPVWEHNGFNLVRAHIEMAMADEDYTFVLAEVDYLKPFWDLHPEYRDVLTNLVAVGRVEIMGGTYNEPNTNLTGSETTIRNLVYGVGYQRDVLGADPHTAWQLDVFGHDPQFPGLVADAGLSSTSWARGPFHQWGPILSKFNEAGGDARNMQFPAEFEWLSPSGNGVLTHYMPNHYSAGWWMDSSATLADAEQAVYNLFLALKPAAATKNTLLPVGTDYTPPNKWVTEIHRDWNARYVWPKFVCGNPRDFFASVRAELDDRGVAPSPQTRDMNPIYTGKDVSYIDTKQAQRAAETAATDAEKLAAFASLLGLGQYPHTAMDKVWRQLAYGAHHDAITGSESDQVYIDLLTGWREAHDLADQVRANALAALVAQVDTTGEGVAVTITNTLAFPRTDLVHITLATTPDDVPTTNPQDAELPAPGNSAPGNSAPGNSAPGNSVPATDPHHTEIPTPATGSHHTEVPTLGNSAPANTPHHADIPTAHHGVPATRPTESPTLDGGFRLVAPDGTEVPAVIESRAANQLTLAFVARDIPSLGWRTYRLLPGPAPEWRSADGATIANEHFAVTTDPARGGALTSIRELASGRELLRDGQLGNELRLYDEYPAHPEFGEGPWHLVPSGPVTSSAASAAESVQFEHSPAGARITVIGTVGELRYEQRITLWHGLDRVDFHTRVLDFAGSDRLLRVKFAADIPGARPVSEVAGAVIARGFGIVDVDSATAPWTLDNPANTFFALSSTAHLRLTDPSGTPVGKAAIAVAEVVVNELGNAAEHARDLVVALGRIGVTATTSTAHGARYGWLHVDSNLPDIRIVLGGPDLNPVAEAVLANGGRAEFDRQLAEHGAARVLVPAKTTVEEAWVANADLRGADALPTLIIAGADNERFTAEVAAVAAEFTANASATTTVTSTDALTLLDEHTVGLLTYGLPGFAVDPTGALHISLMRSCTGWPSGVWLDPPARRTPDGSAFQLEHWTHDFDYALVSSAGDWRAADLVARGSEFSTPLLPTVCDPHPGPLPAHHSLLTVEPARQVQVQTVKAAGNPHATGTTPTDNQKLTVRLVETTGKATTATVSTPFGWTDAYETDLLEQRIRDSAFDGNDIAIELTGSRIATIVGTPAEAADPSREPLGLTAEIAQPVYTRYWLHNRGPAPAGFLPISVAVDPTVHRIAPGETVTATVVLASHLRDRAVESTVDVLVPTGWTAEPGTRPVRLAERGHTRFPLTVTAPADAEPGLYFARVRLAVGADLLEDVITMVVQGGAADDIIPPPAGPEINHGDQLKGTTADTARPLGIELSVVTESVDVTCGEKAVLTVRATSTAADDVDGEAMVVSPWGTWHLVGPYTNGFHVRAGASTEISFEVAAPAHAQPGTWWAMVKLMWFGRVQYSPAIPVRVHLP